MPAVLLKVRRMPRPIGSADVNDYIRAAAGGEYTAKHFRTWAGTVKAAALFAELPTPASDAAATRAIVHVVRRVAADLGSTPAVCRKRYVHPGCLRHSRTEPCRRRGPPAG